jgi:hypothetical protein
MDQKLSFNNIATLAGSIHDMNLMHNRKNVVFILITDEIIRRASGHKLLEAYREYVKLGARSVMCLVESTTKTRQNRSEAA